MRFMPGCGCCGVPGGCLTGRQVWDPAPTTEELKVPDDWVTNVTSGLGPLLVRISGIEAVLPPSDSRQPCLCASANDTYLAQAQAPPVGNGCIWGASFSFSVCTSEGHTKPMAVSVTGQLAYLTGPDRFRFIGSFAFGTPDGMPGDAQLVGGSFSYRSADIAKNSVLDLMAWNTIPYFSGSYLGPYPTNCGSAFPVFEIMAG